MQRCEASRALFIDWGTKSDEKSSALQLLGAHRGNQSSTICSCARANEKPHDVQVTRLHSSVEPDLGICTTREKHFDHFEVTTLCCDLSRASTDAYCPERCPRIQ